jgi:hypothetical protein
MKVNGRRLQIVAALGTLYLALAVFGWGLQYKLSLYEHSDDHASSIPDAKLLSQKERPASSATIGLIAASTRQPQLPARFFALLVVTIMACTSAAQFSWIRNRAFSSYSGKQRLAAFHYFSFRPPPGRPFPTRPFSPVR